MQMPPAGLQYLKEDQLNLNPDRLENRSFTQAPAVF